MKQKPEKSPEEKKQTLKFRNLNLTTTMISPPWPWRRADTAADYTAVVVPLDEAHQHSHSYRLRPRPETEGQLDDDAFGEDDAAIDKDADDEDTTMLVMSSAVPEYSIEGLRREVRRGRREENWTAYESEWLDCIFYPCLETVFVRLCLWWKLMDHDSEIETHQQGHSGHRDGEV